MVPERPDGARQRAGRRRALRALWRRGRVEEPHAVVLQDHRLRRPAARRDGDARVLARARAHDATQLDRPVRGSAGRVHDRGQRGGAPRVHDAARHVVRRDLLRAGARASARTEPRRERRARGRGACVRPAHRRTLDGRARDEGEGRRLHGAVRDQPGQRRAHPDLGRRLRPRRIRDRGDHGRSGARRARPRVRGGLRAGGAPGGRARGRLARRAALRREVGRVARRRLGPLHRPADARGDHRDLRLARGDRARRGDDRLPPARLAALASALLGVPDPDRALRCVRDGARCPTTSSRSSCRTSRTTCRRAAPRSPPPRTGSPRRVPRAAVPRCGRPTRWTPSSTRPGTSCATRIRSTTRRPGTRRSSTTGCRSSSTSAGSSTRSCTCCTRASS